MKTIMKIFKTFKGNYIIHTQKNTHTKSSAYFIINKAQNSQPGESI